MHTRSYANATRPVVTNTNSLQVISEPGRRIEPRLNLLDGGSASLAESVIARSITRKSNNVRESSVDHDRCSRTDRDLRTAKALEMKEDPFKKEWRLIYPDGSPVETDNNGMILPRRCILPPDGWRCTRKPGHDGPCAAIQTHHLVEDAWRAMLITGQPQFVADRATIAPVCRGIEVVWYRDYPERKTE